MASFGPLVVVLVVSSLRRTVTLRPVVVLLAFLIVFSMAFARPGRGGDLWVYAVYGRIIVEHGDSPYVHAPNDYPEDPWARKLELYSAGRAGYGPVFIAATAVVAAVGQDSRTLVRVAYQAGAASALVAAVLILLRLRAPPYAIALLALNPVLIVEVVSQGRMDLYVGLGLLGASVLARDRPHLAAVAIAAVALVKIPAALALLGLVCWVWRRQRLRTAATVAAAGLGTMALAYLAAGGTAAVRALLGASDQSNDVSVWVLARNFPQGMRHALGDLSAGLGPLGAVSVLATVVAVVLAVLLALAHVDEPRPVLVLALPVVAYLLTSLYPTSWYLGWVLPLLALRPRSRVTGVCVALFSLLMVNAFYVTAVRRADGARTLADFARPAEDVVLRILRVGVTGVELLGIVVIVGAALTAVIVERDRIFRGLRLHGIRAGRAV